MSLWRDYDYCLTCKDWVHTGQNRIAVHVKEGHTFWGAGLSDARYYFGCRVFAMNVNTICQMQFGFENHLNAGRWLPDRIGKWKTHL